MSDKTIFGCAETGTYISNALPVPHVRLSGNPSTSYSVAQLFSEAMSDTETATVSVIKDRNNWAVYSGAKFTTGTTNKLDLSAATLQASKGTLGNDIIVTCLGLHPGTKGTSVCRVYRNAALSSPSASTAKLVLDTVDFDPDGLWDAGNTRFTPKRPGYYWVNLSAVSTSGTSFNALIYKNGALYAKGPRTNTSYGWGENVTALVYCNGTTDYLEPYLYTAAAVALEAGRSYMEVMGPMA